MTEEPQDLQDSRTAGPPSQPPSPPPSQPAATERVKSSSDINPYAAPAYHPDKPATGVEPAKSSAPGALFWTMVVALLLAALVITAATQGFALPLILAVVGGTIRALAMSVRVSASTSEPVVPPEMLLLTSTVVTLLLMVCCTIAFATICTSGVLAVDAAYTSAVIPLWSIVCGVAALVAFAFMFIRSINWSL